MSSINTEINNPCEIESLKNELKVAWKKCDVMEMALRNIVGLSFDARAVDLADEAISSIKQINSINIKDGY